MTTDTTKLLGPDALRDLRKRILEGHTPSDEEVSVVLATLRGERSKIGVGKASTAKTARQPLDLAGLFAPKTEEKK